MVSLVRLVLGVVMSVPCRLRFVYVDNNTPMICLYKVVLLIPTIVLTIIKMSVFAGIYLSAKRGLHFSMHCIGLECTNAFISSGFTFTVYCQTLDIHLLKETICNT